MPDKHTVQLGEVQETLLIPLYGRADQTRRKHGLLRDPKAVEMVEAIDYDFGRFDGARSLLGATVRTCFFDAWVRSFLAEHPAGTVVEIGAGLNTRFERVDNGEVHWIDLDLPDVIDLRRRFFAESDRRHMIAASVLDPAWINTVLASPGPYFLSAEAVLVYLPEPQVREALGLIAGHLPGARVALDTAGRRLLDAQDRHDTLRTMRARMTWACDDPAEMQGWGIGLRVLESRDLAQLPPALRRTTPLGARAMLTVGHLLVGQRFTRYRVNLLAVAES